VIPIILWLAMGQQPAPLCLPKDHPSGCKWSDGIASDAATGKVFYREPPDVPAIQVDVTSDKPGRRLGDLSLAEQYPCLSGQHYELVEGWDDLWECRGTRVIGSRHTCADKTRILLHDEQDPPKYWCHRVEQFTPQSSPAPALPLRSPLQLPKEK